MRRDLVEAAQHGDHEAFEVLANASADRLYAIARLILRDTDRAAGKEASGMLLLKELQKAENPPLAIIVSGETNISYPIEALQTYGVLAYINKGTINKEIYIGSVRAVLYYLNSLDMLRMFKEDLPDLNIIAQAWEYWQRALKEAEKAKPVPLGKRTDLRDVPLITIDGHDARDFDDAVFAEPVQHGYRLIVAEY